MPSHCSATSQTSAVGRQTNPAGASASAGQALLTPSQLSATSQGPAAGRHAAVLFASAGQAASVPVQLSTGSQAPAEARQTAPAFPAGCWQASFVPSQVSVVHGLPSSVHAVPLGCLASAGQLAPLPGQSSATSHAPADARHWVAAEA